MSVPLFTTPSRSNFYPQLGISYDSGSGNGAFGQGWDPIPSITRKTDKGLPQYRDAQDSDIFILSDAEDLVPAFIQSGTTYQRDFEDRNAAWGRDLSCSALPPRIEGLFARIEKWHDQATGDVFWKSLSKDNSPAFTDKRPVPASQTPRTQEVFQWLLEESYDDKGNSISYEYKREDAVIVPPSRKNPTDCEATLDRQTAISSEFDMERLRQRRRRIIFSWSFLTMANTTRIIPLPRKCFRGLAGSTVSRIAGQRLKHARTVCAGVYSCFTILPNSVRRPILFVPLTWSMTKIRSVRI